MYSAEEVNGDSSGLLLVWHEDSWGMVCNDIATCDCLSGGCSMNCGDDPSVAGGDNIAQVVCRSLGRSAGQAFNSNGKDLGFNFNANALNEQATGCDGTESKLSGCRWISFGEENQCTLEQSLGVYCGPMTEIDPPGITKRLIQQILL